MEKGTHACLFIHVLCVSCTIRAYERKFNKIPSLRAKLTPKKVNAAALKGDCRRCLGHKSRGYRRGAEGPGDVALKAHVQGGLQEVKPSYQAIPDPLYREIKPLYRLAPR